MNAPPSLNPGVSKPAHFIQQIDKLLLRCGSPRGTVTFKEHGLYDALAGIF